VKLLKCRTVAIVAPSCWLRRWMRRSGWPRDHGVATKVAATRRRRCPAPLGTRPCRPGGPTTRGARRAASHQVHG